MTYFHSAPQALGAGSVILPGNWGRILRQYHMASPGNFSGPPLTLVRELIFENVRLASFRQLPSRLESAFAFETQQAAERFRDTTSPQNVIHEVELIDPTLPLHRGSYETTDPPPLGTPYLPWYAQRALEFWTKQPMQTPELVTLSALRVLRMIP